MTENSDKYGRIHTDGSRSGGQPPSSDKPVAWLYDGPDGQHYINEHRDIAYKQLIGWGWTETPLYTHPTSAEQGEEVGELFGLVHGLIQEAKGGAVEKDWAYVQNHLDDAENWLYKLEALSTLDLHASAGRSEEVVERVAMVLYEQARKRMSGSKPGSVNSWGSSLLQDQYLADAKAILSALDLPAVQREADSGLSGEVVVNAEQLWANLPTSKPWTSLKTHEKALACHVLNSVQREARRDGLEEASVTVEKWLEPIMATPHENATYRSIATTIRALKEGTGE